MRNISLSKILVVLAIGLFILAVIFKFITIQNLNTDEENYHLYGIHGDRLFSISNENNKTLVEIHDKARVQMGKDALYNKIGDQYQVLPHSSIKISDENGSSKNLTYRFMADSSKKSFSYSINRWHYYEIVGGVELNPSPNYRQQHLARLYKNDKPLLAIFPTQKGEKLFKKDNDELYVVALQDGLVYVDKNGSTHKLVPVEKKDLNTIKSKRLQKMQKGGFIRSVGNRSTVVLDISLKDGTRSIQLKKSKVYVEEKTKYLNITEYSNFQNISSLVLAHASDAFYVSKDQYDIEDIKKVPKKYLNAPYEIPVGKKITVKGRNALFGFAKYGSDADFSKEVPRLDNPVKEKKEGEERNSRYMSFLDIDNMFGIYVSDKKAEISYSSDKTEWVPVEKNYKYAPPLYLYDSKVKGQFVAPESLKDSEKKIFYKIVSSKSKYALVFNGEIKVYNTKGKLLYQGEHTHNGKKHVIREQEVIIETKKMPLQECGQILPLFATDKENLTYKFRDGVRRDFNIVKVGNKYDYRMKERLSPFKKHKVTVMKGKNIYKRFPAFKSQLSCRYKLTKRKEAIPSLYAKDNKLKLIQRDRTRKVVITQTNASAQSTPASSKKKMNIPRELIPIYGDGERFGLLSHGLTKMELTIDQKFSMEVANIFKNEVDSIFKKNTTDKPRAKKKNDAQVRAGLKKHQDEFIEGATVVISIDKEGNRKVVSLFSYPYPEDYDIDRELIIDRLNNKKSTIKNRALNMLAHPGSTFKIVTSLALAKEDNLNLTSEEKKELYGKKDLNGTRFSDGIIDFRLQNYTDSTTGTEKTEYTDFNRSFAISYNTYFGYSGLKLHKRLSNHYSNNLYPVFLNKKSRELEFGLASMADSLSFNSRIPLSETHKIYAGASKFPSTFVSAKEVADSAIGQYDVYATPLQMALVTSVIYDNKLSFPTIVKGDDGKVLKEKVIDQTNLETIEEAMKWVIKWKKHGTAKSAFKGFNTCDVYGKTGTAQKGKSGLYDGWFVGYTKGLNVNLVIATVIKNSGTGGNHSAYVNREIIEAWIKRKEIKVLNSKGKQSP